MWNEVEIQKIKQDIQVLYVKLEELRSWMCFFIGTTVAFSIYFIYFVFFAK